jgi:hypothetical protein
VFNSQRKTFAAVCARGFRRNHCGDLKLETNIPGPLRCCDQNGVSASLPPARGSAIQGSAPYTLPRTQHVDQLFHSVSAILILGSRQCKGFVTTACADGCPSRQSAFLTYIPRRGEDNIHLFQLLRTDEGEIARSSHNARSSLGTTTDQGATAASACRQFGPGQFKPPQPLQRIPPS